ncbi:MAG: hypothetical protein Q9185_005421 [Variospora sp. 1 TL-2023]
MLTGKVYVVTSPELVNAVARNSRALAFNPIIAQVGKRITGHDEATSQICQHNLNGEHGPGYVTEIHDKTVAALADTYSVEQITSTMLGEMQTYLDQAEQKIHINLFAWLRHAVTRCSTTAIYGQENPLVKDGEKLDEAFWDFDESLNLLILDVLPHILATVGDRARTRIGAAFQTYFQHYVPGQTASSTMALKRHLINTEYGITPWNAGRLEVGVLIGILANIIPTMFYMLIHIYYDKSLLRRIRNELEAAAVKSDPDGRTRILRVVTLRQKCHLLHATFKEVLRHYALGATVRYVRDDTLLDGRYLLRKGMVVQMPLAVLHRDRGAWGEDASDFRPDRFLQPSADDVGKGIRQASALAFRPFGGGTSLCPGRHVATLETMALAAIMVLRFDLEPVDGSLSIPAPKQESMATNVFPPAKDVRVRVLRREPGEDVTWKFSMD